MCLYVDELLNKDTFFLGVGVSFLGNVSSELVERGRSSGHFDVRGKGGSISLGR